LDIQTLLNTNGANNKKTVHCENYFCCICNKEITRGYRVKDILSGGFGEFESALSITKNSGTLLVLCASCASCFDHLDKFGMMASYNDKTGEHLQEVFSPADKKHIIDTLFNPPAGYFFVAFNRHFLKRRSRGTHFLHNAVINYNAGKCDKYFLTVLDKRILFDINKARQYMQVIPYVKHLPLYLKTGNDKLVDIKKATKMMAQKELKSILQDMRKNYDLAVFTRGLI